MKKKIIFGSIIFLIIIIGIFSYKIIKKKNKDNNLMHVRLAEVTHSIFYTPLYVAIENGYFKDEGLDIELILTPGADKVSAAILSNSADIGFAGAESAIYIYNENEKDFLQIFAGLTKRDGQFIVSREPKKDFDLKELYGKEILVGRKSGMPALNFINALKNNDVDINKININYSVEFSALSGAFIGGEGDYVNLFEPNATNLEQNKYGYVIASVGLLSNEVPYTTFYAKKSYIENNKDIIKKFTKAINKGIKYTFENDDIDVANTIKNQFPDAKADDLRVMIERYKEYDCWQTDSFVSELSFNNLQKFLIDFELIKNNVPYTDLVNNYYEK